MAQRWQATSGVDNGRRFFCELCQKGYARFTDLESHENDYDHQHRKREKDRKQLSKDPNAEAKARAAERRAKDESGMRTISITPAKPKKAPVFKPIGQSNAASTTIPQTFLSISTLDTSDPSTATLENDPSGAVKNGWYQDRLSWYGWRDSHMRRVSDGIELDLVDAEEWPGKELDSCDRS